MSNDSKPIVAGPVCPIPISQYPHVLLAHGGGGQLTHQLIERMFMPAFANPALGARHDGARVEAGGAQLAFTTDSYVVRPLFFPGGDIGALAVNGTVNDLAMCGARPLYLSAGFILEEGLPMDAYGWYIDLRKYGTFVHAGFGLGLERTVSWICGLPHVREAIPFARMMHRLRP